MSPLARALVLTLILALYTVVGLGVPAAAGPIHGFAVKGGLYKGGQNLTFTGTELVNTSDIWTFTGGASLEWQPKRKSSFILLTEVFYIEKNSEVSINDPALISESPEATVETSYLSVPIMGKLRTAGQDAGLYFLLGLSFDFMLDHNDVAYADSLKSFALGVQVGLGFDIPASDYFGFLLEVRYSQDISNSWDGSGDNEFGLSEVKNRGLLFLGGLRF